jgi:folate-binding Fe-S cluster repair protein YgfZ
MSVLDRDLVTVTGPDTFSFLQSLVSQDVEGLSDGAVVPSLLLTPKGKVSSSFRLVRTGDDAWLDVEAGFGDALREALERFRLRVKVEIAVPAEPWGMVALRDGAPIEVGDVPASCRALAVEWPSSVGSDPTGTAARFLRRRGSTATRCPSRKGASSARSSSPASTRAVT